MTLILAPDAINDNTHEWRTMHDAKCSGVLQ